MKTQTHTSNLTHEYRIAKGWGIFIYVFTPLLIALFVAVGLMPFFQEEFSLPLALFFVPLSVGMTGFLVYGLIETAKGKVIFYEDGIRGISSFRTKDLAFSEISGFRIDQNYIHIIPINKQLPTIKVSTYYRNTNQLIDWLSSHYPNLDLADTAAEREEILDNPEFGWTTEQREEKLRRAWALAKVLNYAGFGLALWLFFYPYPYGVATAIALLFPLLVIIGLNMHKGLMRIDEKNNSAYPSLAIAFLMPSMGLAIRSVLDFDILDYQNLWLPLLATTLTILVALLISTREFKFKKASDFLSVTLLALFVAVFAYGACVNTNCYYDESTPAVFSSKVIEKRISSGKTTTYYLKVEPWGPRQEAEEVSVSEDLYNGAEIGNPVDIYVGAGRLGIPWYWVSEP